MRWTGNELIKYCDGANILGNSDAVVTGFKIDSRNVRPGDLFVALPGEQTDGHLFVEDALLNGASACLVSKIDKESLSEEVFRLNPLIIQVEDSLIGLQKIAKAHRDKFGISVVGITGSVGKTTTKDMVASVLETKFKVLKTEGNLNSEIGLPLMLLRLTNDYEVAVLEMGMTKLGQIMDLCRIAKPNVGVITNIAGSHLEQLKTLDNITKAKAELLHGLIPGGTAVLNNDDDRVRELKNKISGEVVMFGMSHGSDVMASNVISVNEYNTQAEVINGKEQNTITLPISGQHNVVNALAALSVGKIFDIPLSQAKKGLWNFQATGMRTQIKEHNQMLIINDTYNANYKSTEAALSTLKELASGRTIAVLGDMYELGDYEREVHSQVGELTAKYGIDNLITVGELGEIIKAGAINRGMDPSVVITCSSNKEASKFLLANVTKHDTILIKGSRGMEMEQIVDDLLKS